jgi:hypothetical protein
MWGYVARGVVIGAACMACGALGFQLFAEYTAWQNTKVLLPQMIQLLNAHEAVLKTQAATPAP